MRRRLGGILVSLLLIVPVAAARAQDAPDAAAIAVCNTLLPAATLAAAIGPSYTLRSFTDDAGTWRCAWLAESASGTARLNVNYKPVEGTAAADYDDSLARLTRTGASMKVLSGIGSAASRATLGTSFILIARKPGAFFGVTTSAASETQLEAVARHVAGISPATVAEARAALAKVNALPRPTPPPLEDVVVRRNGRPLLCEQLLPRAEVIAVVGSAYHLTFAADPRPDLTTCEWKNTENGYPIALTTTGPAEFADARMSGPAEYFKQALSFTPCISASGDGAVAGLGLEAKVCGERKYYTAIVRRQNDVLTLTCPDCTREQILTLARAALR